MRQTIGVGVVLAVAVAAVRYAGSPAIQTVPEAPPTRVAHPHLPKPAPVTAEPAYLGGCTAFDARRDEPGTEPDPNRAAAKSVLDKFFALDPKLPTAAALLARNDTAVHYAIATVPDPRHTNLALPFDRQMVLIQQAAQDDGYTYDSSWLPWPTEEPSFALLADQQRNEDQTDAREACPGILLFRKGVLASPVGAPASPTDPFAAGLVVFIVGEQPTGGLNHDQWANALHWLAANPPSPAPGNRLSPLNILGPTFSGTLPSIERDLAQAYAAAPSTTDRQNLTRRFPQVHLLSGGVTSCSSILWFKSRLAGEDSLKDRVVFGSFAENDERQISRFLTYLADQRTEVRDVAILSEDETAYANATPPGVSKANLATKSTPNSLCAISEDPSHRPMRLSYPRDISAVRTAYDKQSIFTARANASRPILRDDPELEAANDHAADTIPAYSGSLSAIAQESVLYGIVSTLRAHHSRFLLLRCSNPLDFLFLTRFFHHAYPAARIVTVASDLLFRREIDTTEFRGVLALSNYPLLPRNQHWSHLSEVNAPFLSHTHRVFESNAQGIYIAGRYLFDETVTWPPLPAPHTPGSPAAGQPAAYALTLPLRENIPDYANPFWMYGPEEPIRYAHAPVWLSVLGRDGYWPLAVLGEKAVGPVDPVSQPPSTITTLQSESGQAHYDLQIGTANGGSPRFNESLLFSLPLAWSVCVALSMGLLLYQLFAVYSDSGLTSSGLFAPFRQIPDFSSQAFLLGLNSSFAAFIPLLLFSVTLVVPGLDLLDHPWSSLWFWLLLSFVSILALFVTLLLHRRKPKPSASTAPPQPAKVIALRPDRGWAAAYFVLCLLLLVAIAWPTLASSTDRHNDAALFTRMAHLTSGVSPLAPILFLFVGFYLWTWQALAGNVLLADGRPELPAYSLAEQAPTFWQRFFLREPPAPSVAPAASPYCLDVLEYRISQGLGRRILSIASPVSLDPRVTVIPLALGLCAMFFFPLNSLPLLGMEGRAYAFWIDLGLLIAFLLTTAEALRLYNTWIELRRLLLALSHYPLLRTFLRLRAISAGTIWTVSGSVQRTQFNFFSQQLDAARRLERGIGTTSHKVCELVEYGRRFATNSASKVGAGSRWEKPVEFLDQSQEVYIRRVLAEAVADVLNNLLLPYWAEEERSLNVIYARSLKTENGEGRTPLELPLSKSQSIRAAEEFVCLQYIAFIQNILARMRTMVLSMGFLFVAVCLSISFYPFVPRTQIGAWMALNLASIALSVIYVYSGMERDTTLSYITNTEPGRLGSEFYVKTATFLAGPVLGLLTTQFPAISEFVLGFLQPGLDAVK